MPLVAVLVAVNVAAADPAEMKAKQLFRSAQAAYDLGQFQKALDGYSAAYEAKPLPAFLFNIAQCHKQLAHWERALFFYRRFRALAPADTDVAKVDVLIQQMEQHVAEDKQKADEQARAREEADREARALELERAREATLRAEAEATKKRLDAQLAVAAAQKQAAVDAPPEAPLYQRWWVWAGAGAVVVAAGVIAGVAVATRPRAEVPSYGTLDAR